MAMQIDVGEFSLGTVVCLDYTAPPGGMVELNFSSGTEGGDVQFHFTARYDEPSVVLNSCIDGHWGTEEKPSGFPLRSGSDTYVTIVAEEDGFQINSNGDEFSYKFKHRKPISDIHRISTNDGHFRIGKKLTQCQPGKVVYVQGKAPETGPFSLDLLTCEPSETSARGRKDIALHINPQFDTKLPMVVRNTYINGHWEHEDTSGGMPLKAGETFTIAVTWQLYGFEIAMNGWHFASYSPHRLPTTEVMTLMIQGVPSVEKTKYC